MENNTNTRFAVLLRDSSGRVEILGQLHLTEAEALSQGSYWRDWYGGGPPVQAEVVALIIPERGKPCPPRKDFVLEAAK